VDGNPDVSIGGSGVSSANGYILRAKEEIWLDLTLGASIYGILPAAGSADMRILEAGVYATEQIILAR
jgi:hypothetical protein